ncbi:MAG TPA: response regulator [Polyangiaceae bacterium]|jgi:two-component system chemotaxis response regulator CheY|nr:response regulator [Polyangiaceae bacterium]
MLFSSLFTTPVRPTIPCSHEAPPRARLALIVEDDPRVQDVMRAALVEVGFEVLSASHHDAAVEHLVNRRPSIVCIDVGLPDKSGYELCEYIRGPLGLHDLPIIVASEYGSAREMAHAEVAGGNAFLRKPFSDSELSECVASLLEPTPSTRAPVHELERLAQLRPGRFVPRRERISAVPTHSTASQVTASLLPRRVASSAVA